MTSFSDHNVSTNIVRYCRLHHPAAAIFRLVSSHERMQSFLVRVNKEIDASRGVSERMP